MRKKDWKELATEVRKSDRIERALTLYQVLIDAKESGVYVDFCSEYHRLMQRVFDVLEQECL